MIVGWTWRRDVQHWVNEGGTSLPACKMMKMIDVTASKHKDDVVTFKKKRKKAVTDIHGELNINVQLDGDDKLQFQSRLLILSCTNHPVSHLMEQFFSSHVVVFAAIFA